MFKNMTLRAFSKKVGDSATPPGGGVCAAFVASLGISLLRMSCVMSIEQNIKDQVFFYDIIKQLDRLDDDLYELMEKDAEIFSDFLNFDSFSNKQKEYVLNESCDIPFNMIRKIIKCMYIMCSLDLKELEDVKCDILSGIEFLFSAYSVCCHNIVNNAEFFEEKNTKQKTMNNLKILKDEFENLRQNITGRFENEKI